MTSSFNDLLVERDGHCVTLTINRPHKLNAMTKPLWQALGDQFRSLSQDPQLRCIIIRGAGEKAFSPGNDISEFETERANRLQAIDYGHIMHATAKAMQDCEVPIVAQIHGICVGGGLEIAAMADIRICGEGSRFGAPIKNLGLVMAHPEMAPIVRLIGAPRALELLLEGQIIDAATALSWGLVNRVVADDQVAAQALASAQRICDGAPLVARWHKRFARRLGEAGSGGPALTQQEYMEGFDCFDTEDFRRGYQAFLAKRKPEFVAK